MTRRRDGTLLWVCESHAKQLQELHAKLEAPNDPKVHGVRFEKTPEGDLLITHDYPDDAIDPHADLSDWFEWHLTHGWEWVEPIEVEALTDAPILTDDIERDDTGKILRLGRVYVHTRYAIEDAVEELRVRKRVVFKGFTPELRPCMPLSSGHVE